MHNTIIISFAALFPHVHHGPQREKRYKNASREARRAHRCYKEWRLSLHACMMPPLMGGKTLGLEVLKNDNFLSELA
jgi:hypothetical protein